MRLEKLLDRLQLQVEAFGFCRLGPGERLSLAPSPTATVHYVLRGKVVISHKDSAPIGGTTHWLVIVPPDCPIEILAETDRGRDGRSVGADPVRDWGAVDGAPEIAPNIVACGRVQVSYGIGLGLFDALREPIGMDFADNPVIRQSFEMLDEDLRSGRPGSQIMVDSLMRQCLVLLLRDLCGDKDCNLAWLNSLEDSRLVRALDLMLDKPESHITLEDLAAAAGMSRSVFAQRFARAFGETPNRFLTRVRMNNAHALIASGRMPIKAVAKAAGFDSVSHFSRLFRNQFGQSPSAIRKEI